MSGEPSVLSQVVGVSLNLGLDWRGALHARSSFYDGVGISS